MSWGMSSDADARFVADLRRMAAWDGTTYEPSPWWKPSTTPYIARGMRIDLPHDDHDLFHAINEHRATPEHVKKLIGQYPGVGIWWGTYDHPDHPDAHAYGSFEDFSDHAGDHEESVAKYHDSGEYHDRVNDAGGPGPHQIFAQTPVVMVGKRPKRGNDLWDPEIHNPSEDMMGNSYLDDNEPIDLHEVHYHSGRDWVKVPMHGHQVTARTASALSDEARVSVAEQVMERAGHTGQQFRIPVANRADAEAYGITDEYGQADPRRLQRMHSREAEDFVHQALGHRVRVEPNHWDLRGAGSGQAVTDGANYIGISGRDTHAMTLLHEVAHIKTQTDHGVGGHGPEFQQAAHDLYHQHIGPEAAHTFANIVWPQRTASAEGYHCPHLAQPSPATENVLGRDLPREGPFAPSDDDHPAGSSYDKQGLGAYGADALYSLRHVPIKPLLPDSSDCVNGHHGAHCYTAQRYDEAEEGLHGHEVAEPIWNDDYETIHHDEADNVRRMTQEHHKLPALVTHPKNPTSHWGGNHRLAAWNDAGYTHVPMWVAQTKDRTAAAAEGYHFHLVNANDYGGGTVAAYPASVRKPGLKNWHAGIQWDNYGKIVHVDTKEPHRGKGLARALYDHVKTNYRPDLMHDSALTEDGRGFANAVGGQMFDKDEYQKRRDQHDEEKKLPYQQRDQLFKSRGWPSQFDAIDGLGL